MHFLTNFPSAANVRREGARLDTLLWNFTQMQLDASLRRRSAPPIAAARRGETIYVGLSTQNCVPEFPFRRERPPGTCTFGYATLEFYSTGIVAPKKWTFANIERMQKQLRTMGNMFHWKNEIVSCDPEYYKWSQWFFLKMLENDLAYREHAPVD